MFHSDLQQKEFCSVLDFQKGEIIHPPYYQTTETRISFLPSCFQGEKMTGAKVPGTALSLDEAVLEQ